jgi:cell division protein FtsL
MLRFINVCLVLGLVALACVIYQVKYQARGFDADIAALDKRIDEERDAIAVLRAEWSLLNRPERIDRLAKKHLKLAPAKPIQIVTLDAVSTRDFDRSRLESEVPATTGPAAKSAKQPVKPPVSAGNVKAADASAPWPEAKIVRPVEASAQ